MSKIIKTIFLTSLLIFSKNIFAESKDKKDAKATVSANQDNMQDNCIFCQIIARKSPAIIVDETEDIIVIEKIPQRNPVDCLIIPKKHIENIKSINFLDEKERDIFSKIGIKAKELTQKLTGNGHFSLSINNGAESLQTVFHIHAHFRSPDSWKKN